MNSVKKLESYRNALKDYMKKYNKGVPPIHWPLRTDYGILDEQEIFVAVRIEKEFPKPDMKNIPRP